MHKCIHFLLREATGHITEGKAYKNRDNYLAIAKIMTRQYKGHKENN